MLSKIWCLFLLALVLSPMMDPLGGPRGALAQHEEDGGLQDEDVDEMEVEDEEEETVTVPNQREDVTWNKMPLQPVEGEEVEEGEEEEEKKIGPHRNASTTIIFTNCQANKLLAGELVNLLIGFTNDGESEFIITGIEGSFRYPQDFSYYIQNFTVDRYETYVLPETQVSFQYNLVPSESFYARAFGLTVNMHYKDMEGDVYVSAVFNDTVNIVEIEESFDGETFFMYVFMVSGISLLMFICHYVYTTTVRKSSRFKKQVETGTQGKDDIDYQWLPEGTIPGTPKKSPRMRKAKK